MKKAIDLTGARFGRLVVEKRDFAVRKAAYWVCRCDCGNSTTVQACHLRSGATQSCGCFNKEQAAGRLRTHGFCRSRIYNEWRSMKARCLNPHKKCYADYGGRGIMVCQEWQDSFEAFRDWAIANGYQDNLTIDRIDVNGNYEPSNCRWVTNREQQNNKRNNHLLSFNGKEQTIAEWAEETGLDWMVIYDRIRNGWTVERTLTEPLNVNQKAKSDSRSGRDCSYGCG